MTDPETDADDLDPETKAQARAMVEDLHLELQSKLGLSWVAAAHALAAAAIDLMHVNSGEVGTAGELALMLDEVAGALVAVAQDTEDRKARWKAN